MDVNALIDNYRRIITQHYFDFEGRSRRQEFWYFVLVNILITIVLSIIDRIIGTGGIISDLFSLAVLLPSLGLGVRRLHDIDKSGWWLLIALIPLVGAVILIYWYCQPGTSGANQFGADPKSGAGAASAAAA